MSLTPSPDQVARFSVRLDRMLPVEAKLGLAVSGGPDSLALLLLAAAARPGMVEAASVDHGLRSGSADEAALVAELCGRLNVPHAKLTIDWPQVPRSAVQERARAARYRHLSRWMTERSLPCLATAHHRDDQAETMLMRLARGVGVTGLAGIRPITRVPGGRGRLIRPLLAWSHDELVAICDAADVEAASDPSNIDEQFERVRMRKALAGADWLDPDAVARSAAFLTMADVALDWAVSREWQRSVHRQPRWITYRPGTAPSEIRRRVVRRIIAVSALEGSGQVRGDQIERLIAALGAGQTTTLRGVLCKGGELWTFSPAPPRRKPTIN